MHLPKAQDRRSAVRWSVLPPEALDKNPAFLEKRIHQGLSGQVYPLPFTDRISETKQPVECGFMHWRNRIRLTMILPRIRRRIFVMREKTNGGARISNQPVIKPTLVSQAGTWTR